MGYYLSFLQFQAPPPALPPAVRQRRHSRGPDEIGFVPLQQVEPSEALKWFGKSVKFAQKTVGSVCKLSEHPFAKNTVQHIKKWADRISGAFTARDILQGKINLPMIKDIINKIFIGEMPSDEELGILSALIALDETAENEYPNIQNKLFQVVNGYFQTKDGFEWMKIRKTLRSHVPALMQHLNALGMGNKFEKLIEGLRAFNESSHKAEAALKCVEAGAGIGLFFTALGLFGKAYTPATTALLTISQCVAGTLSSGYPLLLSPFEQLKREVKNSIEQDFKALSRENFDQIKKGFRIKNQDYSQEFERFHAGVNALFQYIAEDAATEQDLLNVLNRYLEMRDALNMPQPPKVFAGREKVIEKAAQLHA